MRHLLTMAFGLLITLTPLRAATPINRKGLYSDQGQHKKAFYVLRQWYEGKK